MSKYLKLYKCRLLPFMIIKAKPIVSRIVFQKFLNNVRLWDKKLLVTCMQTRDARSFLLLAGVNHELAWRQVNKLFSDMAFVIIVINEWRTIIV